MKSVWGWIALVVGVIAIGGLILFGSSERQAYRTARGAIEQRVEISQDRIDAVAEMASAAVDLALQMSAELPAQEAMADAVQQAITQISDRLQDAAERRGDAAIELLDQSIEQFNQTKDTIEQASDEASDPLVKARLDRLYGMLDAVQEQIVQFLAGVS
jgi:hypothetical protein